MRRKSTLPVYPSLERFEIIKKLGDGAFSDVYRARDKRTGRNVAIKVAQKYASDGSMVDLQHLHPSMKKKPRVTERANILKEVQIMRNIRHPNIVQLIQFTESRENYFLVLELCEGGELFHRIVDLTYLSEDLSRHVIGQLAQAVYHLHEECGVVHRDIKPENILFDPIPIIPSEQRKFHVFDDQSKKDEGVFIKDVGGGGIGQVKLADFGLSKIIWDKDTLTPCGTVGYTAPEIVKDQRYSKGVDCWAMGCVLFTMLCGFPPFYDESISALTRKVARGEFSFLSPWWDPISDEAKDLIQGLLCVDPRKRYTVRQVLQHPWLTGKKLISSQSGGPSFVDECESIRIQAMRKAAASSTIKSTDSPHNIDSIDNQQTTSHISSTSDLTSTTSSTGRKDVFSPGMATLKEILDITAAVQRMTEEHTNHGEMITDDHEDQQRQYHHNIKTKEKQLYNAQAAAHHQQGLAKIKKTAVTPIVMATGTIHTTNGQRRHQPGFDLNMNNATLLKNRRMKHLVMPCQ
ncbi:kinase-like domain-containing protein [Halteromyces radiatus]|uniref:kinase-like domain-containing protein n=1 Tax=Halteromyces radiatus TaxID=101107 RepID=UPI00221EF787|nr:kinase-like domain-containing protein [Halteromyces radiatus]KAI8097194.1 kinase-like domain-containing protein [Halteromyces radiatus]